MTTLFWCGEPDDEDNKFITNVCSYWVDDWIGSFGGVDDPEHRDGYRPAGFVPKENPFYFALPYGERDKPHSELKKIPWYGDGKSLLKNRWIRIKRGGKVCFAQWADVGPFGEGDFPWVFGEAKKPKNKINAHAGLDLSPACWTFLGMTDNGFTTWEFVDLKFVPDGPWRDIITK